MNIRLAVPAVAVLLMLLTGCGASEDNSAPTPTSTASGSIEPSATSQPTADADVFREYFELLATRRPEDANKAVALAAPGSNARAFAVYLGGAYQAQIDAGDDPTSYAAEVTTVDGGFSLCDSDQECVEYTDIQATNGRIANLAPRGVSLNGRITTGSGKAKSLGDGEVKMLAAYKTSTGVDVVFEVKSGRTPIDLSYVANYRSPNGRQMEDTDNLHPSSLSANSVANTVLTFKGAEFGGEVTIRVYPSHGATTEWTATFKTG